MKNITLIIVILFTIKSSSAQNIGVNTTTPENTLDINGKIKISDDSTDPVAGSIRFNAQNSEFEGFDGETWRLLSSDIEAFNWGQKVLIENDSLVPSDLIAGDDFGADIFYHQESEFLFVGCPSCDVDGNLDQGAVYAYKYQNENLIESKITDPNGNAGDNFGSSIHCRKLDQFISNYLIVGAPGGDKAIVFSNSSFSWNYTGTIDATQNQSTEAFGTEVAVYNLGYAITGKGGSESNVYLFRRFGNSYILESIVSCTSDMCDANFGRRVLLESDKLLISSPHTTPAGQSQALGELYIYSLNNLNQILNLDTIFSILGPHGAHAGMDISKYGDKYLLGTPFLSNGYNGRIDELVMTNSSQWLHNQSFSAKGIYDESMYFGFELASNNNYLLVGAPGEYGHELNNLSEGAVYLFKKSADDYIQIAKLKYSDPFNNASFGRHIAISNSNIFVGMPNHYNDKGKVYVFPKY